MPECTIPYSKGGEGLDQSPACPYIPLNALFLSLTNKFYCF